MKVRIRHRGTSVATGDTRRDLGGEVNGRFLSGADA